jgi:hypothetical protein
MGKASKEIECLIRLDELTPSFDGIIEFLHSEDLLSREEGKAIRSSSEVAKKIYEKLAVLSKTKKLQLLEYEWVILPIERIKVMVVTDRASREFSFNV